MHLKNHNLFKSFHVVLRTKNEEGRMVIKLKITKLIKHIYKMKTVDMLRESKHLKQIYQNK